MIGGKMIGDIFIHFKRTTCYGPESFLSSSIPYLELDNFAIYDHFFDFEINTVIRERSERGG